MQQSYLLKYVLGTRLIGPRGLWHGELKVEMDGFLIPLAFPMLLVCVYGYHQTPPATD